MALLVYNLSAAPLVLANGISTKIPASTAGAGVRGEPWYASGKELRGRSLAEYQALQQQQKQGLVSFVWSVYPEYPTVGLVVQVGAQVAPPSSTDNPTLTESIEFTEPDFETGNERSVTVFEGAPYKMRILQVLCTITRGAPNAQMYLCCHPGGKHEPHSDKFDASSPGQFNETSMISERIIEEGEEVFAYCTTDYVLGRLTMFYQRIND